MRGGNAAARAQAQRRVRSRSPIDTWTAGVRPEVERAFGFSGDERRDFRRAAWRWLHRDQDGALPFGVW